VKQHNIWYF